MNPRLLGVLACLLAFNCAAPAPDPEILAPTPGEARQHELESGEAHDYRLFLEAGQYLQLVVDQRGIDVVITVTDPAGEVLFEVDGPVGATGPDRLELVANQSGYYLLSLESEGQGAGEYEIRVESVRQAEAQERWRAVAAELLFTGDQLRRAGQPEEALAKFEKALKLWRMVEAAVWQGETYYRIGWCYTLLRDRRSAADSYRRAAELFHQIGIDFWEGRALSQLGIAHYALGETELAIQYHDLASRIWQQLGVSRREAAARHNLAMAFGIQGKVQEAESHYRRALELCQQAKDLPCEANLRHSFGALYRAVGEWESAGLYLERAEELWLQLENRRRRAMTLNQLGQLHQDRGEVQTALDFYRQAMVLRRELGRKLDEARTLWKLGRARQELGLHRQALENCQEALGIFERLERPGDVARALLCVGSLYSEQGRTDEALASCHRSREQFRESDDALGEAASLLEIARIEHQRSELEAAREAIEQSLAIIELVRGRSQRQELKTSFYATTQHFFELAIEVLMELGRSDLALQVSERARVRSLLDVLNAAGADVRHGVDRQLLDAERDLQRKINDKHLRLRYLDDAGQSAMQAETIVSDLYNLLSELDRTRSQIRLRSPESSEMARPLDLEQIQNLLDEDTLLMEYRLGTERSHLWLVTPDRHTHVELPSRAKIEEVVRGTYELLVESRYEESRNRARSALCRLSRLILEPAAAELAGKHLLIVADGALQYVPFAALPDPVEGDDCSEAAPLIDKYELTYIPSASTLAVLRQEIRGRRPAPDLVAVVADPVFGPDDSRVHPAPGVGPLSRLGSSRQFLPLPATRREAAAILELVPPGRRFQAVGFAANKAMVTGGELADYRFVHFATHGVIEPDFPELSHIVLSRVNEQGWRRDGYLRAHEIYGLKLPAELVVLSACETALGKEVGGEGLVGLTQGFLSAGAARVMVSLWKVDDASTADLMGSFYQGVLKQGRSPAAALRQAQRELRQQERYSAPFFWAGFVIQGEWRPLAKEN